MTFPVWFLQLMVIGGTILCTVGAIALLVFLLVDKKDKQIW